MATDYPEARELMLAAVLPASTDVYIALWDGDPIDGGAELTLAGYARVAFQAWTTSVPGPGESTRSNTAEVAFPTINAVGSATHWAIHDSAVEPSVLLRSGQLLDDLGQPFPIAIGVGDDVQFNASALRIKVVEA